jgi:hypothetical protein
MSAVSGPRDRHGTHTSLVEQLSVEPVQAVVLLAVHWTQVFVVVSQAGVSPAQFASDAHGSHLPVFGPV